MSTVESTTTTARLRVGAAKNGQEKRIRAAEPFEIRPATPG